MYDVVGLCALILKSLSLACMVNLVVCASVAIFVIVFLTRGQLIINVGESVLDHTLAQILQPGLWVIHHSYYINLVIRNETSGVR